jgi:glycosyltransferase involved in cell wall biosynthesis
MINVFAHSWNSADSYGRVAIETAAAIERTRGVHINRFGDEGSLIKPAFGGILTAYPSQFHLYGGLAQFGRRIALTMFESDQIPSDWIEPLNRCDEVVVTSRWLVDVFKQCGVTTPVQALHLGVNADMFPYKARKPKKPFTFIAIGDGGLRKGSHHAMFAFLRAFGDSPDVRLIIKARNYPIDRFANSNIVLMKDELSDEELYQLYCECDCMVFPSAGEGFGFPPREFAATGGLVIATNWSGTADDIEQWGLPLSYKLVPAWMSDKKFAGLGQWAEPDQNQLVAMMKLAASMPALTRMSFGRWASMNVRRLYSWDKFGASIYDLWSQHDYAVAV